jgi:GNAT superfamily N-acetyltransferase
MLSMAGQGGKRGNNRQSKIDYSLFRPGLLSTWSSRTSGHTPENGSWLDALPTSWQNIWMIQLRDARKHELPSLSALCLRSKAVWGYDDAFMAACRTELTLGPGELMSTHVHVAERGTIAVGLVQIKVTDTDADLLKLFVEPALLRSGVGRLLFEWAIARARSLGAIRMVIEADPGAAPFYERMGARHAGFAPSQSIPGRMLPRLLMELNKPASTRPRVSS